MLIETNNRSHEGIVNYSKKFISWERNFAIG